MRIARLIALSIFLPVLVHASGLVNINTAGLATLETLPHIGATLAQRIIDYRTQNGAFTSVKDLQKVSGIGSGSNYADIAPLVTVGDADTTTDAAKTSETSDTASSTPTQNDISTTVRSASTYMPPPSDISVVVTGSQNALVEVPVTFFAIVKAKGGAIDSAARLVWSFGDGSSAVGSEVNKTFHYAGTYPVTVLATDGSVKVRGELVVTVAPAKVRVAAISSDGIIIANDSDSRLDLSGWRITSSQGAFRIPEGTTILQNASTLFPFFVLNFPTVFDAALTYPNGIIAARFAPASVVAPELVSIEQPVVATTSYIQVQKVEPIISIKATEPSHAKESVNAPAAATELAAAGAALPGAEDAAGAAPAAHSIFRSPWTFGLFGVIAIAATAFVLL